MKLIPFFLIFCSALYSQDFQFGVILDEEMVPLEYVTIGLKNSSFGTSSDLNGHFYIPIKFWSKSDSVKFTHVGFHNKVLSTNYNGDTLIVILSKETRVLDEIKIVGKGYKKVEKGYESPSNIMDTGWGNNSFGGERGIKLKIKRPMILSNVSFFVRSINYDSALIRLHLRPLNKKSPEQEIIKESLTTWVKLSGWNTIEMADLSIPVSGDILVSIELVKSIGKCSNSDCFKLAMTVPGGSFYYTINNFSEWQKKSLRSPTIKVELLE